MFSGISEEEASEASDGLCELLRQYIQLKLAVDIEEIYVCFRLLKRYAGSLFTKCNKLW